MLLLSFLLFCLCGGTEERSPLRLTAAPDYPVGEGQKVNLHCSSSNMTQPDSWSWEWLGNQTWQQVGVGQDLTLTEPEQSGLYRCLAGNQSSPTHRVVIVSIHATAEKGGESLGEAALALSLLALIITLGVMSWLVWRRLRDTTSTSNSGAKSFPGPEKTPKTAMPQADADGDVYMNYASNNQAYVDLDPTSMTMDNVYSSLS